MKLLHRKHLPKKFDLKVRYSFKSILIGSLFILPWGYGIYAFMWPKLPKFITYLNILFWFFFFVILVKQVLQFFDQKKFLLAFRDKTIYFSLNYGIKNPDPELDVFFSIDLKRDLQKLSLIKEARYIPYIPPGKIVPTTRIKHSTYFRFDLNHEIEGSLRSVHRKVCSSQGFSGSPVLIKNNAIEFYLDGNTTKLAKILTYIKSKRVSISKLKKKSDLTGKNVDPATAEREIVRLKQLKDSVFASKVEEYLIEKGTLPPKKKSKS